MTNPFARVDQSNRWVIPVSLMALIVGVMVSAVWISKERRDERFASLPADIRTRLSMGALDLEAEYNNLLARNEELSMEIEKLRSDATRLQNVVAEGDTASLELNDTLQQTKMIAGLTELVGPGVLVTLSDSKRAFDEMVDPFGGIVHDLDVLKVVNELFNAGAEGASVNNKRVGPRSNFRCVGSVIMVDGATISSPVEIRAIGDPKTLHSSLNMPGGVLEEIRMVDPGMVKIEIVESLRLPAFSGPTSFQQAKVPDPSKQ